MVMVTPKKKKSTQEELTLEAENQTPLPARKQKLKAMVKKRPAASPVKKPAAKLPQKETEKKMWLKMYYKAGAWAIRKAGGPQLFQIVCKPGKKVEKNNWWVPAKTGRWDGPTKGQGVGKVPVMCANLGLEEKPMLKVWWLDSHASAVESLMAG